MRKSRARCLGWRFYKYAKLRLSGNSRISCQEVVARASRPFVSIRTGEPPVPLLPPPCSSGSWVQCAYGLDFGGADEGAASVSTTNTQSKSPAAFLPGGVNSRFP